MEHFSLLPNTEINAPTKSFQRHAVFHSYFSDDRKQDSTTTNSHRKSFIGILKKKVLNLSLSAIWENTDGCNEQYRRASEL